MNEINLEIRTLKNILWIDFVLGFVAGIAGNLFTKFLTNLMNIPNDHIIVISSVTILYSVFAFCLAQQKTISFSLVKLLINANWFWTIISLILLTYHADDATGFGLAYLLLQVLTVAVLAFWEGVQLQLVVRAHNGSKSGINIDK